MKTVKRFILYGSLVFAMALSAVPLKAQGPTTYRPGEVIRISVTFDGPDASKIVAGNSYAELKTPVEPTQSGFQVGFGSNSQKTGPNTFELSYKVPDNQASGDYELLRITATAEIGHDSRVNFDYIPPDIPVLKFKIENPNTVKKPRIKNVTVLPKP
jgi:hypothetical protein